MDRYYYLFIIAIAFFTACSSSNSSGSRAETSQKASDIGLTSEKVERFLLSYGKAISSDIRILVIPGVGCSGCISQAQDFFYDNYKSTGSLFVFTGITDLKMFNIEIPDSLRKRDNVIVDDGNKLMELGYDSIYPCYIEKGSEDQLILVPFSGE